MKDDYLWDGSGEPDPEIERLEQLLGRYRHEPPMQRRRRFTPMLLRVAAALVLFLGLGAAIFALRFHWPANTPWRITNVAGSPTIDGQRVDDEARLAVGRELRTDARSRVTMRIARVGEVEIGPESEVTLVATGRGRHRMQLERGTLSARLWAPPFTFGVFTPAGLASDVGCAFTLQYENGRGLVRVTSGWVEFENASRTVMIPTGAMAEVREDLGPGSPYYPDAPPALVDALRAYDFEGDARALDGVLSNARTRDAMTLLHLLEHSRSFDERGRIFDVLVRLAPPPEGVTRGRAVNRDLKAIDGWRRSLGLRGIKTWWVNWKDAF